MFFYCILKAFYDFDSYPSYIIYACEPNAKGSIHKSCLTSIKIHSLKFNPFS